MGKIRTRTIGLVEEEKDQKDKQKVKNLEKKMAKKADKVVVEPKVDVQEAEQTEKKAKKAEKVVVEKKSQPALRHKKALAGLNLEKMYSVGEAVTILKKIKYANFDESVELHINAAAQGLRGEVELPFSTGKKVRVAIVSDALLTDIADGKLEFDVLISHPSYMPKLARFARVLGPKGLMPNPKTGTISDKPEEVAKKFMGGLLKWKGEAKFPLIHQMVAKISQDDKEIVGNVQAFIKAVGVSNIQAVFIKTTMSPALKLSIVA